MPRGFIFTTPLLIFVSVFSMKPFVGFRSVSACLFHSVMSVNWLMRISQLITPRPSNLANCFSETDSEI